MKIRLLGLVLGVLVSVSVFGQTSDPVDAGRTFYEKGDYLTALTMFQKLVSNSDPKVQAAGYLWLSKTYFALLDFASASRNLVYYLQNFPKDPGQSEAAYLQGRVLFSEGDYDKAIQAFGDFLAKDPKNEQVPNALFWMGESSFALGHYDEATTLYSRVIKAYPTSYKVEASRYRLAIIELHQREEELLKLLRWSHTEALNAADEFQRREKAYQQALLSYQKKLLDFQGGDLGAQIAALQDDVKQKDSQITALKLQLSGQGGTPVKGTQSVDASSTIRLLELKSRALDLKAYYLDWKDSHAK